MCRQMSVLSSLSVVFISSTTIVSACEVKKNVEIRGSDIRWPGKDPSQGWEDNYQVSASSSDDCCSACAALTLANITEATPPSPPCFTVDGDPCMASPPPPPLSSPACQFATYQASTGDCWLKSGTDVGDVALFARDGFESLAVDGWDGLPDPPVFKCTIKEGVAIPGDDITFEGEAYSGVDEKTLPFMDAAKACDGNCDMYTADSVKTPDGCCKACWSWQWAPSYGSFDNPSCGSEPNGTCNSFTGNHGKSEWMAKCTAWSLGDGVCYLKQGGEDALKSAQPKEGWTSGKLDGVPGLSS